MTKPELVVAPLTPFTGDLKIDDAALKREIDYVDRGLRRDHGGRRGCRGAGIHLSRPEPSARN